MTPEERLRRHADRVRTRLAQRVRVPVLTLNHLAIETETDYAFLRAVVERRANPYHSIVRRKDDGSVRVISSPDPELMQAQRWILRNLLADHPGHPASFAYRPGRSIVGCAEQHIGARWLLKLDLHDFFGSIREHRAHRVFRERGLPRLLSFELARICTRVLVTDQPALLDRRSGTGGVPAYSAAGIGVLPQGAPTSGAIANAVATPLDHLLDRIADDRGFAYTRYSDDLTFSTDAAFDRAAARAVIAEVSRAVTACGFAVHHRKTRVISPGSRKVVLGLLVGDERVRLLPNTRRRLANHIRGVAGHGLDAHATHRRFESTLSFVNHLEGWLSFAQSVEPEWAAGMRASWEAALAADPYGRILAPVG